MRRNYTPISIGQNTWKRGIAKQPSVSAINRYLEQTPTDLNDQTSFLLRPVLKRRLSLGTGPIRAIYQQDGFFSGDMFVVSGGTLYRVAKNTTGGADSATAITGAIAGTGVVYMTGAHVTGGTEYLWIADGSTLQFYDGVTLATCSLPDDVTATSLDYIKSYVIVTVGEPFAQRFYWVQPGATTIDPLDFAEAESNLDHVLNVKTIGDQFWLFGTNSSEPWYVTGDAASPMSPLQGRPFSKGVWADTVVKVNDSVICVGEDGRVYDISGKIDPISYPGIEERIRKAMHRQIYGDF